MPKRFVLYKIILINNIGLKKNPAQKVQKMQNVTSIF